VSFSYEAQGETVLRAPHELAYELRNLAADEIVLRTTGLDRNVRDNCIATSDGRQYALEPVVLERIHRKEVGVRRHQKRLARCQKGSRNRRKLIKKIARKHAYGRDARDDFSHKVSYDLATSQALMFVLEKLHIKGLTKRPKTKQDPKTGKWLPNGRRSKAALNQKILYSCWGSIALKLNYKTARRNKLTVKVPAAYSSQECSRCGHTHPDNRKEDRFACQRCGLEAHADTNAALVIRKRGLKLLGEGAYEVAPKKKRVGLRRKNSGTTGGLPAHVCGADVRPEAAELPEQRKAIRNEAENAAP
jgi:putative transposase